jgi:hypothetical protein
MWEAIFGLIGVVVGSGLTAGFNYYRDRREREEKYRVMLYEKRLEAHQRAFYYIQKLNEVLNTAQNDEDIWKVTREAREWWDSNCLYLDEESRKEMIPAINYAAIYRQWMPEWETPLRVWQQLEKTKKAVVSGIGMKHIEEPKEELPEGES